MKPQHQEEPWSCFQSNHYGCDIYGIYGIYGCVLERFCILCSYPWGPDSTIGAMAGGLPIRRGSDPSFGQALQSSLPHKRARSDYRLRLWTRRSNHLLTGSPRRPEHHHQGSLPSTIIVFSCSHHPPTTTSLGDCCRWPCGATPPNSSAC